MTRNLPLLKHLRIAMFIAIVAFMIGHATETHAANPPNVIILLTDDQGYGELSIHGNPVLQTPNLDALARESIRLDDFHVAPMCTPTRGQLLTGLDALRNGATCVSAGRSMIRSDVEILPQYLQASGYATGMFGKWHLGDSYPYRPTDRGFDDVLRFESSYIGSLADHFANDYFDSELSLNGQPFQAKGYNTDVFFSEAMDWMEEKSASGKPFFCYLPTAAPHWPHFAPKSDREQITRWWDEHADELPNLNPQLRRELFGYLAMISNVDQNVGRLESFLKDKRLKENTLLIYFSDNGGTFAPAYYRARMRGKKQSLFEGGHRVPCFIRWPEGNLRPAAKIAGLTQVQDLLPTILDLLQIDAQPKIPFDCISLKSILKGTEEPPADRMIPINYARMSFFKDTFTDKLTVPHHDGGAVLWKRWRLIVQGKQLFDLERDPMQSQNVAVDHPDVVQRMSAFYDQWFNGVRPSA
ncbi:MAG: arylsulfatase, partial [Planctomycetota bacterium]